MPLHLSFEDQVVVIISEGRYTVAELCAAVISGLSDPKSTPRPSLLFDARLSTSLSERTANDMREVAAFFRSQQENIGPRMATVTSGQVEFGLMRMATGYLDAEGLTAQVFTDMESARRWLLDTTGIASA